MPRVMTPELMDDPAVGRGDLDRALAFIRAVNHRLGGTRALLRHLSEWSWRWPKAASVTLLDVATGSADIPVRAVRWAREHKLDLRITAIDAHATTLELAREHVNANPDVADAIKLEQIDSRDLVARFGDRSFDYVHAGMFLHHLDEHDVVSTLGSMDRLARRGLVWNDLVRSPVALGAVRILTLGAPPIVRHDAAVSVRKGFTRTEVLALALRAGLGWCLYESSPWTQRFTLAGERAGAWSRAASAGGASP